MNDQSKQHGDAPWGSTYLLLVAFCSGMTVMGVEMCAGRLLAPFFGTSLSIWTIIVGSLMIALTIGYYCGGILAERAPRIEVLSVLLSASAAFIVFLPYLAQPLMESTLGRFAALAAASSGSAAAPGATSVVGALTVCTMLISAPVVVLGMTSPFIIRLDSVGSDGVGRISGRVFAVSTVGSIIGTFLPALVLIPRVGTRLSFLFFGGLLLCTSVWSAGRSRPIALTLGLVVLLAGLFLGVQGWGAGPGRYLAEEKETLYQNVRIYRVPVDAKEGEATRHSTMLLTDAGLGMQSMWVEGQRHTDSWQDFYALVPRIHEVCNAGIAPQRLLVLGLGGACAPYVISQLYPEAVIDGVEIDGELIRTAIRHFPFSKTRHLTIHVSDARLFLRSTSVKYDAIIVDVFRPPHIPFHVATAEFFAQVRQRLTETGILAMNVGSHGEHRVFKGIANTVAAVLPYVYYAQYYSSDGPGLFTNRYLVASDRELSLDAPAVEERVFAVADLHWREVFQKMRDPRGFAEGQHAYFRRVLYDAGERVLTDDRSPLDVVAEREFLGLTLGRSW